MNGSNHPSSNASGAAWDTDDLLIDVRSPGEFATGYVEGAINLPLDRFVQAYESVMPDKSRQIVLYCQSGARSGQALQFLAQQGYGKVVNGISAATVALKTGHPIRRG